MAQIVVDGTVVEVPDGFRKGDLEQVLYDDEPELIISHTREEFHEQARMYQRAQLILSLIDNDGFKVLTMQLQEDADEARRADDAYRGIDKAKIEELRLKKIVALEVIERIQQIIFDAKTIQKPIWKDAVKC